MRSWLYLYFSLLLVFKRNSEHLFSDLMKLNVGFLSDTKRGLSSLYYIVWGEQIFFFWGVQIHTRFDDHVFVSRPQVSQKHKPQIVSFKILVQCSLASVMSPQTLKKMHNMFCVTGVSLRELAQLFWVLHLSCLSIFGTALLVAVLFLPRLK